MAKLSEAFRKESSYKVFFLSMVTFGLAYGLGLCNSAYAATIKVKRGGKNHV